jgi:hypothetical protein
MLKKLLFSALVLCTGSTVLAQTIVSTTPENKKVILEEFTGIDCVFCPQGHAIANQIKDANPGNVFLVNIHQGGFAVPEAGEPDFRTVWGDAIANQTGLEGYPAATVNRHVFPGQSQSGGPDTAMSRNQWTSASNATLGEASYVNVGVVALIDPDTRTLTVDVETFHTANSPEASNLLNVALLQNNTFGPQTGGNMGDEYLHEHRLIELLTGQWGLTVAPTTTGSLFSDTITYVIPADLNGEPIPLGDLELVAYVTETQQEVISGNGTFPSFTGLDNDTDLNYLRLDEIPAQWSHNITPVITLENVGNDPISDVEIEYSVNGGTVQSFTYDGPLFTFQTAVIELPNITFDLMATNNIDVNISDDDNNANNVIAQSFDASPDGTANATLTIVADNGGNQIFWNMEDGAGTVFAVGGNYANGSTTEVEFTFDPDCFTFNLVDTGGNGGPTIDITDDVGTVLFSVSGDYGDGVEGNFSSQNELGIEDTIFEQLSIYPNPASTVLNIVNAEKSSIQVMNMLGQVMYEKSNIAIEEQVNVSSLSQGAYFVRITNGNAVTTSKFVVTR